MQEIAIIIAFFILIHIEISNNKPYLHTKIHILNFLHSSGLKTKDSGVIYFVKPDDVETNIFLRLIGSSPKMKTNLIYRWCH